MRNAGRRLGLMLLATLAFCASGCFGVSQNPSYFPHWVPFCDMIPTQAKPPGPSYYSNFDTRASKIVLMPLEATGQVRTQYVLLATLYDDSGLPLRNRRVEWMVDGVGHIIEADASGIFPGRGWDFTGRKAVSYTNWCEHRLSRGNSNLGDDVMLRPGQTWCVISSPVEGDTHVTAYAPGIYNWDNRVVHTTIRWVDVSWEFPPPAVAKFGSQHVFTTKVMRFTDRRPLEKYQVRYKIIDGPPAAFMPGATQEFTTVSDDKGNAQVAIAQVGAAAGANRVSVEILRPPDPTAPSGAVVPIASGETRIEWLAPEVALGHAGPPSVSIGQEVVFTSTLTNNGRVESKVITLTHQIPDGLEFVRTQPISARADNQLVWTLGSLGQTATFQSVYKAVKAGTITSVAVASTGEGQRLQKEAATQVVVPGLKVDIDAPVTGVVNQPISYKIILTNTGTGPLEGAKIRAQFDKGLEFDNKPGITDLSPPEAFSLAPGQSRSMPLTLTPRVKGQLNLLVTATAVGLKDEKRHTVTVVEPKVSLGIDGPDKRNVSRPAEWKIRVVNDGDATLTNVVVRDRLPPELEFESASDGGQHSIGEVTWILGSLEPRKERVLELRTKAVKASPAALQKVTVSAEPAIRQEAQKGLEIVGVAAFNTDLTSLTSPVEVGKPGGFRYEIVNPGSAALNGIVVVAESSAELKVTKATGPNNVAGTIVGQKVSFPKIDGLQPGAKATFTFEVEGAKAGEARFEAVVTTDIDREPTRAAQSTRVVAPLPGPNGNGPAPAPAPPPPPGGGIPKPLPPG